MSTIVPFPSPDPAPPTPAWAHSTVPMFDSHLPGWKHVVLLTAGPLWSVSVEQLVEPGQLVDAPQLVVERQPIESDPLLLAGTAHAAAMLAQRFTEVAAAIDAGRHVLAAALREHEGRS